MPLSSDAGIMIMLTKDEQFPLDYVGTRMTVDQIFINLDRRLVVCSGPNMYFGHERTTAAPLGLDRGMKHPHWQHHILYEPASQAIRGALAKHRRQTRKAERQAVNN